MRKLLPFLAGLAMGLAVMIALRPAPDTAAEDSATAALQKTLARQRAEIKQLRKENADLQEAAAAPPAVAPANAPGSGPSNPFAPGRGGKSPLMAMAAAMMKNPGMRDMIAAQQKGVLQIQYQDLLNHFQMSADERDQFMKLILDKQMARMDLGMQAMSADGNQTADEKAALKQQMSEQDATADAQIQDFFNNDADFAYFQTYEKQLPEHQDLSSLNTSLTQAGQPLNDEQSDAMLNLMVQASKDSKAATPTPTDPTQPPSGSAMDAALQQQEQEQNEIAEGAASVLTPQQLDILKREQAAKMQMLKVGLQMSRQMFGGGSGPSGSAGNSAPAPPP